MDTEIEANEEVEIEESTNGLEFDNLVDEVEGMIESLSSFSDYRRTQKKGCYGLVRHIKLLLPFLEEIKGLNCSVSEKAVESEAVMMRFRRVHDKLCQVLEGLPSDELGISDEVNEQVELMRIQLRRANTITETQDIELEMDMMVALSKKNEGNSDSIVTERLALELHTVDDLKAEMIAIENLVSGRGSQNLETKQKIIIFLNKFKELLLMEVNDCNVTVMPEANPKSSSLAIPPEFLCPITLEIMTDPVIIASGQTYERDSIQKWFNSNKRTCPKTRQGLAHFSLASNYALKNLIQQWCEKNEFHLPKKIDESARLELETTASCDHMEEVCSTVRDLSSTRLDVQRKAAKKIRMLSKENPQNRILIADSGGIPPLISLLQYPDSKIQENAVTALLNLSIDENNKRTISRQGAIPLIIDVLENGSTVAKENSAAALFSLSMHDENKITVGLSNGIPPLVDLLTTGTVRGKKDAATALFNLSLNNSNKARAVEAGIIPPLLKLLKDRNLGMVDEALSIFLLLISIPEGRSTIDQLSFIETLVDFIKDGTPKNKECATSVLLELGSNNSSVVLAALQFGAYQDLVEISKTGTNRAQRKANALLQLMSKCEQL